MPELRRDRLAGGLIPVHTADNQHAGPSAHASDDVRPNGPTVNGEPNDQPVHWRCCAKRPGACGLRGDGRCARSRKRSRGAAPADCRSRQEDRRSKTTGLDADGRMTLHIRRAREQCTEGLTADSFP